MERKVTVCDSNTVAITEKRYITANAVLSVIGSRKLTGKNHYKTGKIARNVGKLFTIGIVAKQLVLDRQSVSI